MTPDQQKEVDRVAQKRFPVRFWTWPQVIRSLNYELGQASMDREEMQEASRIALEHEHTAAIAAQTARAELALSSEAHLRANTELISVKSKLEQTEADLVSVKAVLSKTEQELLREQLRCETLETQLAHVRLDLATERANHDTTRAGLIKLLEWIHATHRLSAPPGGVRKLLQSLGRFRQ